MRLKKTGGNSPVFFLANYNMHFLLAGIAGLVMPWGHPPTPFFPIFIFGFSLFLYLLVTRKSYLDGMLTGFMFGITLMGHLYFWITSFIVWAGIWAVIFWIVLTIYHGLLIAFFSSAVLGILKKFGIVFALLSTPLFWTLLEYLASFGIFGIPETMGHSQILNPFLRSGAPLLGVNYLSFLSVSFSSALVLIILAGKTSPKSGVLLFTLLIFLVGINFVFNHYQGRIMERHKGHSFLALLVQPTIDSEILNNPSKGKEIFSQFFEETRKILDSNFQKPEIIIWPEMVFPFALNKPGPTRDQLFGLLRERNFSGEILIGGPSEKEGRSYYNTAVLFKEEKVKGTYEKEKLFPFGEYVPLKKILGFIKPYLPLKLRMAEYSSGKAILPIEIAGVKAGMSICLESLYTDLIRQRVDNGAYILLNLTNDSWFAGSYAELGHFYIGAMRALENGRPFLQSASVGVNGMIDKNGQIVESRDSKNPGSLLIQVTPNSQKTLFTRLGMWRFAVFIFLTALYFLVYFGPSWGSKP